MPTSSRAHYEHDIALQSLSCFVVHRLLPPSLDYTHADQCGLSGGSEAPDPRRHSQRDSAEAPPTASASSLVVMHCRKKGSPGSDLGLCFQVHFGAPGGLEAPDPNRPFQRRPTKAPPTVPASSPDSAPGSASLSKGALAVISDGQAAAGQLGQSSLGSGQSANAAVPASVSGQGNTRQAGDSAPIANAMAPASASGHGMARQSGSSTVTANATAPASASGQGNVRPSASSAITANAAVPVGATGHGLARQAGSNTATAHAVAAGSASVQSAPVRNGNTAQNRVLAKLGLSQGGQQGSKPGRVLPSANSAPNSECQSAPDGL